MTGGLTKSKSSVVCRTHRCILLEFQMTLETLAALKCPFVFQWVIQFCDQLDNLLIFPSEIGPCHYLAVLQADDFLRFFWCSPMVLDFREYCLRPPVFCFVFFLHFEVCFNDTVSILAASSSGCRLQLTKHPLKAPLCKTRYCALCCLSHWLPHQLFCCLFRRETTLTPITPP